MGLEFVAAATQNVGETTTNMSACLGHGWHLRGPAMNDNAMATNPYAPPKADVGPTDLGKDHLASRGSRLGAAILDGIISSAMYYVPFLSLGGAGLMAAMARAGTGGGWNSLVPLLAAQSVALTAAGIGILAWIVITVILVARNGQTIAKKLIGIRVARPDGTRASLGRIFWLRNVVVFVISVIPLVGAIFVLVDILMIFGEERRCLHDRIADTIVVNA